MYIRRDRSNLHFGRMQRRRPWRGLIVLLLIGAGLAVIGIWQFEALRGQVNAWLGEPPTPTPAPVSLAQDGYSAYLDGDLEEAAALLGEAVAMAPDNADYLYEYGHLLLLLNDGEGGLAVGEQLVTLAPGDPRGPALEVSALYQLDRLDEATAIGLSEMDRGSTFALTYAGMAWVYADLGRWERAVEVAEQALALDPNSVDAYRAYAYALTWVGARQQAAQALEAAVELQPNLDFLYFELALAYRALQDVQQAIYAYERVLALDPTNTRALLRLCETYFGLREDARAEEYCVQALDVDDTYSEAWRAVGQVYYMEGQYQKAINALEQCVALGNEDIRCWYVRGLAYYYMDRCDRAVPILQESLERTQSDQILGYIRQGLRLCQVAVEEPTSSVEEPTVTLEEPIDGG